MSRIDNIGQNGNNGDHYEELFKRNKALIETSGLKYRPGVYNGKSIVFQFRDPDKPTIDFYPHTGRWKIFRQRRPIMMEGGAEKFIRWYSKIRRG